MSEDTQELTKEQFIEEMEEFDNVTSQEILEVLEKHKHLLSVEVLGLISIARAIINNFGDEYLMKSAIDLLQYQPKEQESIEEADDIIKETE